MTFFTLTIKDGAYTFSPVDAPPEPFWVAWPIGGSELPRITDKFNAPRGYANGEHEGVDCDSFMNATGKLANVLAAQDGIVEYISKRSDNPSYGTHIVIRHPWNGVGDRYRTLYAHLSSVLVSKGDTVKRGQTVGISGATGTNAVHLHFGVYDAQAGLKGYVRCRDCTALFPEGVIDPESVLRYG
jgi:murein DD-endopeptidase MepM/ murein hydrolase activator NlpD